jgi:hypothetical protein
MTNVTAGSLDDSTEVEPSVHIFVETKVPWFNVHDTLPKLAQADVEAMVDVWKQERQPDE